jgi:hypothetical protein
MAEQLSAPCKTCWNRDGDSGEMPCRECLEEGMSHWRLHPEEREFWEEIDE